MKTIIVYGSHHHGNTKKVVLALAEHLGCEAADAENGTVPDLAPYEHVIFASGIDFGRFYPAVVQAAERLPRGRKVSALYTAATVNKKTGSDIRAIAEQRGCVFLGAFGCKGHNTYGPWKLIGGINKQHPDAADIAAALAFVDGLGK